MTATEFRKLALSLDGASEASHNGHPDFRFKNKIFASLGYPDDTFGMVKLTPSTQARFVRSRPDVFEPAAGVWGVRGSTLIKLQAANARVLKTVFAAAWAAITSRSLGN